MRKIILVLCFFSQSVLSVSESVISDYEGGYSALCITEDSTGFSWKDNKWKRTNYTSSKYLAKKIPHSELDEFYINDIQELNKFPLTRRDDQWRHLRNYYNIREFGEEFYKFANQICSELWDGKELLYIACEDFKFKPNGYFHKSGIYSSLSEKEDYKDSLFVEYGKCSKI